LNGALAGIAIATLVPPLVNAYRFVERVAGRTRAAAVTDVLNDALTSLAGARLGEVRIGPGIAPQTIIATVRSPRSPTPADVDRLERALPRDATAGLHLRVRSVPIVVAEASGYLYVEDAPCRRAIARRFASMDAFRRLPAVADDR
jgi:hypothetical protein